MKDIANVPAVLIGDLLPLAPKPNSNAPKDPLVLPVPIRLFLTIELLDRDWSSVSRLIAGSALSGADLRLCGHHAGSGCSGREDVERRPLVSVEGRGVWPFFVGTLVVIDADVARSVLDPAL